MFEKVNEKMPGKMVAVDGSTKVMHTLKKARGLCKRCRGGEVISWDVENFLGAKRLWPQD